MMKKVFDVILGLICAPIAIALFVIIGLFATALWLPYSIWWGLKRVFFAERFAEQEDDFVEFIFLCYGLAAMCIIMPFVIVESSIKACC